MRGDLKSSINPVQSLRPAARTTTANGATVDLANIDAATVVIDAGTWTDGTHTFAVQDSDDNATFAGVPASLLDSAAPVIDSATDDDQIYTIGYHGTRRYLRVTVTITGAPSTGAAYSAQVIRGRPRTRPVS